MLITGLLANAQVSETRDVSTFNKIEITDGVELIYTQSDTFSLKAEASDGLGLSTLLTKSENNTLRITCKGNLCEAAKVYVSAPELVSIKASRNSKVVVLDKLKTEKIALSLASGAQFRGNVNAEGLINLKAKSGAVFNIRVEAGSLHGNFQDDAKVNLSGNSGKTIIRAGNNALCSARNFKSGRVDVMASDNASITVSVLDEIAVEVGGDAMVRYFGFPGKTSLNPEAVTIGNPKSLVTQN